MKLPDDLTERTVPAFLFDRARGIEDRPRFVVRTAGGDHKAITWGEHAETVRRIARYITARGLGRGDRVAVYAGNSVAAIAAAFAIQAAGATTVFVHASSTAEQAAYCVRHADARIVFVDDERLARLGDASEALGAVDELVSLTDPARGVIAELPFASRVVTWSEALATGRAFDDGDAFERTLAGVGLDDVAILLYTSGTTGDPKGVPLTHRNLVINWAEWLDVLSAVIPEQPVDLLWLPITHVFGFGEVLIGHALRFTTYLTDPRTVASEVASVRPSVFLGVPSVFEKLAAMVIAGTPFAEATGGRLSLCLSGGASLQRNVKELFHGSGVTLFEGYGLSETSPTLTVNGPGAFRFDAVGRPLPSVELRLADDGEILARGPTVFSGYFRDPEATRAAFDDEGWFHTGDIGLFTDDGFLRIVDRKKDLLVTAGGKNVAPAAIEARFHDDPFVERVVLYGEAKRYLVAALWANEDAIRAHLDARGTEPEDYAAARLSLLQQRVARVNAQLPSHETIKRFVVVDLPLTVESGLLTPSLKLKRGKVWDALRPKLEALYDAPSAFL